MPLTKHSSATARGRAVSSPWQRAQPCRWQDTDAGPRRPLSRATAIVTHGGRTHLSGVSLGFLSQSSQAVAVEAAAGARNSFACTSSRHYCRKSSWFSPGVELPPYFRVEKLPLCRGLMTCMGPPRRESGRPSLLAPTLGLKKGLGWRGQAGPHPGLEAPALGSSSRPQARRN